jgi:PAS domain S-box-containing protein
MADLFRSGDALVAFDSRYEILAWNEAAEQLTGVPAAEALGRRCWEVLGGREANGGIVCHAGCSVGRLAMERWPVATRDVDVRTPVGRRRVAMATIAVSDPPVILHLLRNAPDGIHEAPLRESCEPSVSLTPRQLEVLQLLGDGETARVIADRLALAETTVRNHIRAILLELGAHSQLEAVAKARRLGLVA